MVGQQFDDRDETNEVIKGSVYNDQVNRHHRVSRDGNTSKNMLPFHGPSSREVELTSLPSSSLEKRSGLYHGRALIVLVIWYTFSFTTLVLNKCILSYQDGDPVMLGKCPYTFRFTK